MTAARIFKSATPLLAFARLIPMCPKEQAILDELRRRRTQKEAAR